MVAVADKTPPVTVIVVPSGSLHPIWVAVAVWHATVTFPLVPPPVSPAPAVTPVIWAAATPEYATSRNIITTIFSEFVHSTPGVSIEVTTIHGYPSPISAALDLAIFVAHQKRLPDSSLSVRQVGTFRRQLYSTKEYLKRRGIPEGQEDLQRHDCILFSLGDVERKWELLRGRERRIVAVGGTCSAGSGGHCGTVGP
jgi:hypothetical protein